MQRRTANEQRFYALHKFQFKEHASAERMEQLIGRSSRQLPSRYDTFTPSGTLEENQDTALLSIKKLYEDVQNTWQKSTSSLITYV